MQMGFVNKKKMYKPECINFVQVGLQPQDKLMLQLEKSIILQNGIITVKFSRLHALYLDLPLLKMEYFTDNNIQYIPQFVIPSIQTNNLFLSFEFRLGQHQFLSRNNIYPTDSMILWLTSYRQEIVISGSFLDQWTRYQFYSLSYKYVLFNNSYLYIFRIKLYDNWYYHTFIPTMIPDNKVHGANMGSTWVLSAPDGPHVGPMNLAIRDIPNVAGIHFKPWPCLSHFGYISLEPIEILKI